MCLLSVVYWGLYCKCKHLLSLFLPLSIILYYSQEVYFGFNSMDASSAVAVVEALANKKELKKVDFNGNFFEPLSMCM